MTQLKHVSDVVYQAEDKIVSLSDKDVKFLKDRLKDSGLRKRNRICAHKNIDDALQEMIIVFAKGSYNRPSRHIGKEESIHILEGTGDFVFFNEKGDITHAIPVGDASTGRQVYVRTPNATYHSLLISSKCFVVHETTQGPFKRSDTLFAEWAPDENNTAEVTKFMDELAVRVEKFRATK